MIDTIEIRKIARLLSVPETLVLLKNIENSI